MEKQFTVTITERPKEITNKLILIPNNDTHNTIALHDVSRNSMCHSLGLNIGDELIAINSKPVSNMSISDISQTINEQQLPFNATFAKFEDNPSEFSAIDDSTDDDNDDIFSIFDDTNNPEIDNGLASGMECKNENDSDLINEYILQSSKANTSCNDVCFDIISFTKSNDTICLVSSNGFRSGYHEWSVEILECDFYLQEIGVVGIDNINHIKINNDGIKNTAQFKSRAIFGNDRMQKSVYYGSYNEDNKKRCFRDLSNKMAWNTGDVIKVCLDLENYRIKYLLNGQKVRKKLSLEKNKVYYPCISFSGNCQFGVVNLYHAQ